MSLAQVRMGLAVKYPIAEARGFYATQAALRDVGLFQAGVRCNHTERLVGTRLCVSAGTLNIGTLLLLPTGTIYRGTLKRYLVVSVLRTREV